MISSLVQWMIISILLILVLPWSPWWAVFIIPMVVSLGYDRKPLKSALLGFLAAFVVWFGANYYAGFNNDHIMSQAIGNLFGGLPHLVLYVATGVLGGIYGGLGAYFGQSIKNTLLTKQ